MADLTSFYLKSEEQIREDLLRSYAYALVRRGISNPNVSWGTEIYAKMQAIANQISVAMSNTQLMADAVMPDSAQGTDLERHAAIVGLSLGSAGGSAGFGILSASVSTPILIPLGAQLVDPSGLRYQADIGGTYSNGDQFHIKAIDTGAATNLAAATVLKWTAPPPYVNQTTLVATGGLTGGVDAETHEGLRKRLIEYYRNPPSSGNWSDVNRVAEASSASVQKAFTYPACNGPATIHVAVVTAPTSSNKERDLDSVTRSTIVAPAIAALIPEYVELIVNTVQNQNADVSFAITIPDSTQASPPGTGGGWVNGEPFPKYDSNGYANVTSVTSTTQFAVNSDLAPSVNITKVCWLSPFDWKLYQGKVTAVSGSGPYTITVDTPFIGISTDCFISPLAERSQEYFDAILEAFALMGPGQKTNLAGLLPRAYRKPLVTKDWPSDLDARMLKALVDAGDEVLDASYLAASTFTPSLPSSITDAPFILIPHHIGIYPT